MDFEDRWMNIWKRSGLPNMAKDHIPICLSEKMKRKIVDSKQTDEELGALFCKAVDKINQGSIAGVKELILRKLE